MPDFDITVPHISRVYDYWLGSDASVKHTRPACVSVRSETRADLRKHSGPRQTTRHE